MFVNIPRRGAIHLLTTICLISIFFCFSSAILNRSLLFFPVAYAAPLNAAQTKISCPAPAAPTRQSLLIVLLDRSGSLTDQSGATDPKRYSTSVTKALADLWPGKMAVVPFSKNNTPVLGPADLSDPQQQGDLKAQIEKYPIEGDTPLAPAVHAALDLLRQRQFPQGSRLVVITDGNPTGIGDNDGPHQEQDIRQNLLPQLCQQGVPFSAFGLTIDPSTSDGQDANKLLSDIESNTGASYTNVKGPEDLAREVIKLYSQWQHLTFTPVQPDQRGNYPLNIDAFARKVSIVSFRSEDSYAVKLIGPDSQLVRQDTEPGNDHHYIIDNLTISGVVRAGTYVVNVGGDPNAQVYALVDSPLNLQLLQPTSTTIAHMNQSVTVQAQFIDDNGTITPEAKAAQVLAKITLMINGRPTNTNTVVLTQQKTASGTLTPIFSGGTLAYQQVGELHIEVLGTYQQAQRQTSISLQLLPLVQPPSPLQNNKLLIIGVPSGLGILLLLALLVLFFLRLRPKPYGYITDGKRNGEVVALNRFSKSIISSHDLEMRSILNFKSDFELVFRKDNPVKIRTHNADVAIEVPGKIQPEKVTPEGVDLEPGSWIYIDEQKAATFETYREDFDH